MKGWKRSIWSGQRKPATPPCSQPPRRRWNHKTQTRYLLSTNHRFVFMRMITRKKPAFTELYQTGVLTRIAAVKSPDGGGWRLFGLWRGKDIAVFVEAARGGIREWSGLDYLANFCASCGISLWEVHNKVAEKSPQWDPASAGLFNHKKILNISIHYVSK